MADKGETLVSVKASQKGDHFSIFVVGETGNGKSQFCQFLTSDESTFQPSQNTDSVTQCVFSKKVKVEGHSITVYDTPGLNDKAKGGDAKHIEEMVRSLRSVQDCKAFLIVLNPHQPRFTASTQQTVEYFRDIFGPDIVSNLALVWTRSSKGLASGWRTIKKDQKISKEKEFTDKVRELFGTVTGGHIPSFYINSSPDDDAYVFDQEFHWGEIKKLLTWGSANKRFDCGSAKVVKTPEKKREEAEEAEKKARKREAEQQKREDDLKRQLEEERNRRRPDPFDFGVLAGLLSGGIGPAPPSQIYVESPKFDLKVRPDPPRGGGRCAGITQKNQPCKLPAQAGRSYCHHH